MATRASDSGGRRPVGVIVIDDSRIFLEAVREVIASTPQFEFLGETVTGEEGVALAMRVPPDLVLVDVLLPGIDGLETCRRLRALQPAPLIVLCSVEDDPRDMSPDLPCAAAPFLNKRLLSGSELLRMWQEWDEVSSTVKVALATGS